MASLIAEPAKPRETRIIKAGRATLHVPLHLPREIKRGTIVSGSAILGSKEDCDITYDQYLAVHWSDRPVERKELLPTEAYEIVSEVSGAKVDFGNGRQARVRDIRLSAEKPCGRTVKESLKVIELFCANSRTHVVIAGMLDPFMTKEKVSEIAESLQCP